MNREDSTRLRGIVDGLAGRTRYEGQAERTDEFLVRIILEAFAQQRTQQLIADLTRPRVRAAP